MCSLKLIKPFNRHFTTSSRTSRFDWPQVFSDESKKKCIENLKLWKIYMAPVSDVEKFSAVLIPIVNIRGSWSILYTLRSSRLSSHIRQVSFPGKQVYNLYLIEILIFTIIFYFQVEIKIRPTNHMKIVLFVSRKRRLELIEKMLKSGESVTI